MTAAWFDHALAFALAVLFPIRAGTFGFRRLVLAPPGDVPRVRRALYTQAMALQWGLAALTAALWIGQRRPWDALGLLPRATPLSLGVTLLAVVVAALLMLQARRVSADDHALAAVLPRLERIRRMLPHDGGELRRFVALSLTAGVCEEILYRGFLMWYLGGWLGPAPSLALAAVIFGIGHSYQGWRGVLVTGLAGAVFGAVYLLAGSLLPAIILHAAGDIHSGLIAHAALRRESAQAGSSA